VGESCLHQSLSWGCFGGAAHTQPSRTPLPLATAESHWFGDRCTFPAPGCLHLFRMGICSRVFAHASTTCHNVQASRVQAAALRCKHSPCFPLFPSTNWTPALYQAPLDQDEAPPSWGQGRLHLMLTGRSTAAGDGASFASAQHAY